MLSNLFDSLKGNFASKSYWVGAMIPLVLFATGNLMLLDRHYPAATKWILDALRAEDKTPTYLAVGTAILVLAYTLMSVNSILLQGLEGKSGPIRWLGPLLCSYQWRSLDRLNRKYLQVVRDQATFKSQAKRWAGKLDQALNHGAGKPRLEPDEWFHRLLTGKLRAYLLIRLKRTHGLPITARQFRHAVVAVAREVSRHDARKSPRLHRAYVSLEEMKDYAQDRLKFETLRIDGLRQLNFPGLRPTQANARVHPATNNILAPTQLGNIGRTIRSYGLTRYQLDLDILWTRLQNALKKDGQDYHDILETNRAAVDCMVALVWLTGISTLAWTIACVSAIPHATRTELISLGTVGPGLTWVWYRVACQSYRVFADVMRSSVDLFRFNLLTSLHIPLPHGINEEQLLWKALCEAIGFAEDRPITYKHP